MIKSSAEQELTLIKKKFLSKVFQDYDKLRLLNWNFILRNLNQLKTESFTYLFVDNAYDILKSNKHKLKSWVKKVIEYNNVSPMAVYKIKFLSEHQKPFYWYSKKIDIENFNNKFGIGSSLKHEIKSLALFLDYHIEILDMYASPGNEVYEIGFLIHEKFISSEL